jgi:hypothetical protein
MLEHQKCNNGSWKITTDRIYKDELGADRIVRFSFYVGDIATLEEASGHVDWENDDEKCVVSLMTQGVVYVLCSFIELKEIWDNYDNVLTPKGLN